MLGRIRRNHLWRGAEGEGGTENSGGVGGIEGVDLNGEEEYYRMPQTVVLPVRTTENTELYIQLHGPAFFHNPFFWGNAIIIHFISLV